MNEIRNQIKAIDETTFDYNEKEKTMDWLYIVNLIKIGSSLNIIPETSSVKVSEDLILIRLV